MSPLGLDAMAKTPLSSHLLIGLQFMGIFLSFVPLGRSDLHHPWFLAISVLGLVVGLATFYYNRIGNFKIYPEPKQGTRLITNGPYSLVRHPMYSSLLLLLCGVSLYQNYAVNYVGFALVAGAVYGKGKIEEQLLVDKYPEYREYMKCTWRFVPWVF